MCMLPVLRMNFLSNILSRNLCDDYYLVCLEEELDLIVFGELVSAIVFFKFFITFKTFIYVYKATPS